MRRLSKRQSRRAATTAIDDAVPFPLLPHVGSPLQLQLQLWVDASASFALCFFSVNCNMKWEGEGGEVGHYAMLRLDLISSLIAVQCRDCKYSELS